jgi:mRNA interferase RelE/StbE
VASYRLELKKPAAKELEHLPLDDCRRVVAKIRSLARQPRPVGCEKLSGEEKYRIRQGDWRVLYEIDDAKLRVTVVKIAHRREAYR